MYQMLGVTVGVILFAASYTYFIVPAGFYSMGFTGIAQMIHEGLERAVSGPLWPGVDITGMIVWIFNIPLIAVSFRVIGRKFVLRSAAAICLQSFLMAFVPAPESPLIQDPILNCMIGGGLCGYGVGLALRCGGSGGGTDMLGMICAKKWPEFSVGKAGMCMNAFVFLYAMIVRNLETACYSLLFSFVSALVADRTHDQNVTVAAVIISSDPQLGNKLMVNTRRGVTSWKGWGEYSGQLRIVHLVLTDQHEWKFLKKYLGREAPGAFSFTLPVSARIGKFEKRLEV